MSVRAVAGLSSAVANILAKSAIPFIIAPTGTMANNGAITLGTALPATYANAYINLPANAIQAGSVAGWYFCQMSSATVGTVFNNTYTTGVPTIPASPVAFVSTGPGAYTGVTTAVTAQQITVPANSLGPNGMLRISELWSVPANTDGKTLSVTAGGVTLWTANLNTSQFGSAASHQLWNRGLANANVSVNTTQSSGIGNATGAINSTTINFGASQAVIWTGQLATATDFIVVEAFTLEVMP